MTISSEAVEKAAREYNDRNFELKWDAVPEWARDSHKESVRAYLESAAPIIRSQALEDAAQTFGASEPEGSYSSTPSQVIDWLRALAMTERGEG